MGLKTMSEIEQILQETAIEAICPISKSPQTVVEINAIKRLLAFGIELLKELGILEEKPLESEG